MIRLEPLSPAETPPPGGAYPASPAWAALCRGLYGYDLREFRIMRGSETLGGFSCAVVRSAVFGTRLISLPFSDEPGLRLRPGAALSPTETAALRAAGLNISAPLPTDAAWAAHLAGKSDGLLALYHDQALAPLKTAAGTAPAVHWTWGLSFTRTSPAHGTAFDLAGRGQADASGMREAILFAARLAKK